MTIFPRIELPGIGKMSQKVISLVFDPVSLPCTTSVASNPFPNTADVTICNRGSRSGVAICFEYIGLSSRRGSEFSRSKPNGDETKDCSESD